MARFEAADTDRLAGLFAEYEAEAERILAADLLLPAYDYVLKCSHVFNLLDARGAVSAAQRTAYLGRCRQLARACARAYLAQREAAGFPLLDPKRGEVS